MQSELATIIDAAENGDGTAADALFARLYSELHRIAKRELARHRGYVTLGATTVLHEAYLDMAAREGPEFPDRARFMAYAARVMRGLIIDYARNRSAQKRGGKFEITSLATHAADVAMVRELTPLGEALDELAKADPTLSMIVDLKFFCGFSFGEIGEMTGVCERTIQRNWEKARIYLHTKLRTDAVS